MTSPTIAASYQFEQRTDLASLFQVLLTNDLSISDLADKLGHENTRYTRELMGLLLKEELALTFESPDGDLYTAASWEDDDAAWSSFRDAFPEPVAPPAPANPTSTPRTPQNATLPDGAPAPATPKRGKTPTPCLCGCTELTPSNYRPGHDARHAGMVAKRMSTLPANDAIALLGDLPSPQLQQKALKMADRLRSKTAAHVPARRAETEAAMEVADDVDEAGEEITGMEIAAAEEESGGDAPPPAAPIEQPQPGAIPTADVPDETVYEMGQIKSGRYAYRARRNPATGATERNSNRAGTGTWSPANAVDVQNFKADK